MLRLLMIVSGTFEALFGLSALIAPEIGRLARNRSECCFLLPCAHSRRRDFGVGAALLARNDLNSKGGLAATHGLGLYNVLAAGFILWTAVGLGGAALWSTGLVHAVIGALFVYALAGRAQAAER